MGELCARAIGAGLEQVEPPRGVVEQQSEALRGVDGVGRRWEQFGERREVSTASSILAVGGDFECGCFRSLLGCSRSSTKVRVKGLG